MTQSRRTGIVLLNQILFLVLIAFLQSESLRASPQQKVLPKQVEEKAAPPVVEAAKVQALPQVPPPAPAKGQVKIVRQKLAIPGQLPGAPGATADNEFT